MLLPFRIIRAARCPLLPRLLVTVLVSPAGGAPPSTSDHRPTEDGVLTSPHWTLAPQSSSAKADSRQLRPLGEEGCGASGTKVASLLGQEHQFGQRLPSASLLAIVPEPGLNIGTLERSRLLYHKIDGFPGRYAAQLGHKCSVEFSASRVKGT
ncbi:hypothetical protein BO71DRAFT_246516 [Aspergillus ellipticus CBS 707.79]|uniref:Secreted protein n=1 Tax=Aspergillus ellipticus CBS 707.79 TaxID=1448320 RepID=A0A319D8W0_9EURO|nr:hypothetical protein BO71DRAFT_246516 [Aspergillus ellipticus CBS 707.79]